MIAVLALDGGFSGTGSRICARGSQELSTRNYRTGGAYPLSISGLLLRTRLDTACIRTR